MDTKFPKPGSVPVAWKPSRWAVNSFKAYRLKESLDCVPGNLLATLQIPSDYSLCIHTSHHFVWPLKQGRSLYLPCILVRYRNGCPNHALFLRPWWAGKLESFHNDNSFFQKILYNAIILRRSVRNEISVRADKYSSIFLSRLQITLYLSSDVNTCYVAANTRLSCSKPSCALSFQ